MKYVQQFGVILLFSLLGEVLHRLIPLPVPASIYGMVLLLMCLQLGVVQPEHVQDAGKYLIEIMPIMFIPAAVGLMDTWPVLQPVWVPVVLIMLISTLFVMAVTGWCTQGILRLEERRQKRPSEVDAEE